MVFQFRDIVNLTYSTSLIPNNLHVALRKETGQYDFCMIHKYGVLSGSEKGCADSLKKPWVSSTTIPPAALALSVSIFQAKLFFLETTPVFVALTTRGPYIALDNEFEPIPGLNVEESAPSAAWSMCVSVAILPGNRLALGNCEGKIQIILVKNLVLNDLTTVESINITSRSKVMLQAADDSTLAVVDSQGKFYSWNVTPETVNNPVIKGIPLGITATATCVELTTLFAAVAFSNGKLRLLTREHGSTYCEVHAHATAITAITFSRKSSTLLTVGEDSYIRIWTLQEDVEESKISHIQHLVAEDLLLCGVQFLNAEGSQFGVVGFDRNELIVFDSK